MAGTEESPVYAILKMKKAIAGLALPEGYELKQYFTAQPWLEDTHSVNWDGEWYITYEVFRDLGIAFVAVPILIYAMVVPVLYYVYKHWEEGRLQRKPA